MRTVFEDGNYPTFYRGVGLICSRALFPTDLNHECLSLLRLYAEVQSDGGGQNVVKPPPRLMTKPEDKKKNEISKEGKRERELKTVKQGETGSQA